MRRIPFPPVLAVLLALLVLAQGAQAACMLPSVVDGYVKNTSSATVQGATVSVYVLNCIGTCCSGNYTSETNGYYRVNSLNLPANGNVTVYASKGSSSGSATGQANFALIARGVNVTICAPPTVPTVVPQSNTHATSASLSWTSGTDPNSYTIHDEFQFDGGAIETNSSPRAVAGLSYSSHTWQARTCNNYCCSAWNASSFSVVNNAPSAPNVTDQPHTASTSATLQWVSGTDSDGDPTYDQFQLNGLPVENATSPKTVSGLASPSFNTWSARTCDSLGACSAWASDNFIAGTAAATACPAIPTCPAATAAPGETLVPYCPYGIPTPTVVQCLVPYPPQATPLPTPIVAPTPAATAPPSQAEKTLGAKVLEANANILKILAVDGNGNPVSRATVIIFLANGTMLSTESDIYGVAQFFNAGEVSSIVVSKKDYTVAALTLPPTQCTYTFPAVGKVSCEVVLLTLTAVLSFGVLIALARRTGKKEFGYKYAWAVRRKNWPWQHITVSRGFFVLLLISYAAVVALSLTRAGNSPTGAFSASYGNVMVGLFAAACIAVFGLLVAGKVFKKKN